MTSGAILRRNTMGSNSSIACRPLKWVSLLLLVSSLSSVLDAQIGSKPGASPPTGNAGLGIELASKGRCGEAIPILKKAATQLTSKDVRYNVLMSTARCAIGLDQTDSAVLALVELNRRFPEDPEVLYLTTHYYSEVAMRASHELATKSPNSPQAQQLEAEGFESQGEWDKAVTQYRAILEKDPQRHGIHYRLGRLYLTRTPPDVENAKKELDAELKVDPNSAAAEFLLGEIARQSGQWEEAIGRYGKAARLDEGFSEAYLALGMSMNSANKFTDAVGPLEKYVKMQPDDPAGHYQLATAYARTGRKQEAQREMALQQETAARLPREAPQQ